MTENDPQSRTPFPLPKPRMSWLSGAYAVFGAGVLGLYWLAGSFGWGSGEEERDVVPASVRHAPGGYRGYHLWHSGYQGGK
jgi:hypothetical protein